MWTDEDILKAIKVADLLWEYKIKAKIKEIDELYNKAETDEFGNKDFYGYDFIMDTLKELIGDEK